jgi:hypothetical protein
MHVLPGHQSGRERVLQLTDLRALLEHVDHERRRCDERRLQLLLAPVVSPDGGDEGAGRNVVPEHERAAGWGTGHAHVALTQSGVKVRGGGNADPEVRLSQRGETLCARGVCVKHPHALEWEHSSDRGQLNLPLGAASYDRRGSRSGRARYFAATAVAAPVRNAVTLAESIIARGSPVSASARTTVPRMVGRPKRCGLSGKFAFVLAAK